MNIYVIEQDADYDEYEAFTVAAHDEAGIEQAIRNHIAVTYGNWDAAGKVTVPLTEETGRERIDRYMEQLWPTKTQVPEWRKGWGPRTVRLVGTTTPDITEPSVLLAAFRAG